MDLEIGQQYIDENGKKLKYIGLSDTKQLYLFEWVNHLGKKNVIRRSILGNNTYNLLEKYDNQYNTDTDDEYLIDPYDGGDKRKSMKRKSMKRKSMKRK